MSGKKLKGAKSEVKVKTSDQQQNMNREQSRIMIDFMKNHSKFAANAAMGCNPTFTRQKLSDELRKLINAAGPEKTDVQIWASWKYMQRQAKKYNAKKRAALKDTGNKTSFKINDKYEDVLQVVGTSHQNGLSLVPELGCQTVKIEDNQPKISNTEIIDIEVDFAESESHQESSVEVLHETDVKNIKLVPMDIKQSAAGLSSKGNHHTSIGQSSQKVNRVYTLSSPNTLIKSEPCGSSESDHSQQYKQYGIMSRRRQSIAEIRTNAALNGVNEGNNILRKLSSAFGTIQEGQNTRNKLIEEQNKLLRAIIEKRNE